MLRMTCPHFLSHDLVRETFLRGDTLKLTSSLPVNKTTVGSVINMGSGLIHLELIGFDTILDQGFAAVVTHLTSLRVLNLRGCTKVGQKTIETAAKRCPNLTTVNLNYTSVSPVSLVPLLLTCQKHLEVLKLAGISSWANTTIVKALSLLPQGGVLCFPALRTLKLRQTSLTDISLNLLLPSCPALRRLDISFTGIRHPHQFMQGSRIALEKLSLTSTAVSSDFLVTAISCIPSLRILSIGALGGGPGQAPAIRNTTAMTLTDDALSCLVDVLDTYESIKSISLVGNTKLGMTGGRNRALADFVARIGRRLKVLNLAGIPSLRSEDLIGLLVDNAGQEPSRLQELILNNTAVDDDAAPYISSCSSLETLEVAGTKFTSRGLFTIVDACTLLTKLDLTSCRGVRIVDRRRFFQVCDYK
ncbi:hypothetical protein HETIRDRAFT_413759 [Heterobasidion irregulare TC 32-1]|uniref:RNI-like protein n=1 Tax=Heterobasidion irregulare (strain TC 32-1) TaxID=747525 RepID=W4KS19_HETIT|nr:uncharacterized protein HETIRDRAFT_413759 [Heterobasidion irregulare TC 32-1]ETW87856.1 hypothetical protein HETIRDRAFT_413759 [Heterobasidion irregulare TC 32-1]